MWSGAKVTVHQRHNWTSLSQCSLSHTHTHTPTHTHARTTHTQTTWMVTASTRAHCLILSSLQRWQTGRRLRNYLAWWRSWLRHLITTRKVVGSIPDGVIGIIHWHNLSCRHMTLMSTQTLTSISTSNTTWLVKAAGAYGWHPNHLHVPTVRNLGASLSCNLRGMSRPVTRIAYGFSVVELRMSSGICITLYNFSHTHITLYNFSHTHSTANSPFWEAHIRTSYQATSSIYTTRMFISAHNSPPL